jgi:ABC-type ATPase involved in cell division
VNAHTWDFSSSPTAWGFRQCREFASFIVGPVGSGKSVPLLQRILEHGREQMPSPDGKRRTRFAIVRNTMPELRSTTAVTYQQIYPGR